MRNTLSYLGDILNKEKITWIVGGSIILNYYGITETVNDIDLIVDINDFQKVEHIIDSIGEKKEIQNNGIFKTEAYLKCVVNNIEIDIMATFKIKHNKGLYEYQLNDNAISKVIKINNVLIPLGTLRDWYDIYKILPGREDKVELLEEYFRKKICKRSKSHF